MKLIIYKPNIKLLFLLFICFLLKVDLSSKNILNINAGSKTVELYSSKKFIGISDSSFSKIRLHLDNDDLGGVNELQKIKHCGSLEIFVLKRDYQLNQIFENLKIKQLKVLFIRSFFPLVLPNLSKVSCDILTLNASNYIEDTNSALPKNYLLLKVGYTNRTILPKVLQTKKIQFESLTDFYFSANDSLGMPEISEGFFDRLPPVPIDADTNEYNTFFSSFLQSNKGKKFEFVGISMREVNCEHINVDTIVLNTLKVSTLTLSNLQSNHLKFIRNISPLCKIVLKKPNSSITSLYLSSFKLDELPIDLTQFTNLRELTLDFCTFKNLNLDLKNLKKLKKLNIKSLNIPQKQYDKLLSEASVLKIKLDIKQNPILFPN